MAECRNSAGDAGRNFYIAAQGWGSGFDIVLWCVGLPQEFRRRALDVCKYNCIKDHSFKIISSYLVYNGSG